MNCDEDGYPINGQIERELAEQLQNNRYAEIVPISETVNVVRLLNDVNINICFADDVTIYKTVTNFDNTFTTSFNISDVGHMYKNFRFISADYTLAKISFKPSAVYDSSQTKIIYFIRNSSDLYNENNCLSLRQSSNDPLTIMPNTNLIPDTNEYCKYYDLNYNVNINSTEYPLYTTEFAQLGIDVNGRHYSILNRDLAEAYVTRLATQNAFEYTQTNGLKFFYDLNNQYGPLAQIDDEDNNFGKSIKLRKDIVFGDGDENESTEIHYNINKYKDYIKKFIITIREPNEGEYISGEDFTSNENTNLFEIENCIQYSFININGIQSFIYYIRVGTDLTFKNYDIYGNLITNMTLFTDNGIYGKQVPFYLNVNNDNKIFNIYYEYNGEFVELLNCKNLSDKDLYDNNGNALKPNENKGIYWNNKFDIYLKYNYRFFKTKYKVCFRYSQSKHLTENDPETIEVFDSSGNSNNSQNNNE